MSSGAVLFLQSALASHHHVTLVDAEFLEGDRCEWTAWLNACLRCCLGFWAGRWLVARGCFWLVRTEAAGTRPWLSVVTMEHWNPPSLIYLWKRNRETENRKQKWKYGNGIEYVSFLRRKRWKLEYVSGAGRHFWSFCFLLVGFTRSV